MKKNHLFRSTAFIPAVGPMSARERQQGRYLREEGGHPTPSPSPTPTPAPTATPYLPESLSSLDGVPAPLQAFYVKDGDKFKLDDVNHLRGVLANVKTENQQVKGKLTQFQELQALGLSADQIKQLKEDADKRETDRLTQEGDFRTLKEQMETNFNNEKTTWGTREGKLVGTITKILVDDQARAVLADPEIEGSPTLLLPVIRDRVKVTETDDGFDLQVLRADGAPLLNAKNEPASLKDLFLELKEKAEYAGAFKGVNHSGGGAPSGKGGGGAPQGGLARSKMSSQQKVAYIQEHGQDAFFKLPV